MKQLPIGTIKTKTNSEFQFLYYLAKWLFLKLNKYETDPYFLHFFQCNTTVCFIIHVFCNRCEPEIVFILICPLAEQFHVHRSYKTCESIMLCIGNFEENMDLSHIHLAVLLQNFHGSCTQKSFEF